MKTLCGLLAATLLLSFAVCPNVVAAESSTSSANETKTELGRYQLVAVGSDVFRIDTATGATKVLVVVDGILTFVVVNNLNYDFGSSEGTTIPADDPRAKQYLELLKQLHGQFIRRRNLRDAMILTK